MIKVNKELCVGCGACTALCPDTFKLGDDNKSEVISQNNINCAKQAVLSCPVQAIRINR
jgi:ferredoxin